MLAYCGRPSSASFCDRFPYIVHSMRGKRSLKAGGRLGLDLGRPRYGDHYSDRLLGLLPTNACRAARPTGAVKKKGR
jgi:hypothetical protein